MGRSESFSSFEIVEEVDDGGNKPLQCNSRNKFSFKSKSSNNAPLRPGMSALMVALRGVKTLAILEKVLIVFILMNGMG